MTDNATWQAPGGGAQPPVPQYGESGPQGSFPPPGSYPPPAPAAAGWTPPPKPGLIPLRPLQLGTLLGASFQVMRRNPRPTLGTSLLLNGILVLVVAGVVTTVTFLAFGRIESATSADQEEIAAGTIGASVLALLIPVVLSVVAAAILQGIIALEVARGTIGEKLRLGGLWRLARGRIGALVGWSFLLTGALVVVTLVLALIVVLGIAGGTPASAVIAIIVTLLLLLVVMAASVWLGTKLSLVPSVLVLERATLGAAMRRSWSLTGGYFWKVFGIQLLVNVIVQTAAQVITTPVTLVISLGGSLLNPNGSDEGLAIMTIVLLVVTSLLSVVFGAVSLVILSAVSALIYIDLRMRKEGLDLELARYVEARQAGATSVENPYETVHAPAAAAPTPTNDSPWA